MNKLENCGLEQLFYLGRSTPALRFFVQSLLGVSVYGDEWRRLRVPQTLQKMLLESKDSGGVAGVADQILTVMNGASVAFIENKFPYDGLFPEGSCLRHTCLWSSKGLLSRGQIAEQVQAEFTGYSAVIFENNTRRKSIPQIWHVHAVVDMLT